MIHNVVTFLHNVEFVPIITANATALDVILHTTPELIVTVSDEVGTPEGDQ